MLVKDIMTTKIFTAEPNCNIIDAIELMRTENIGFIPICDFDFHMVGLVTDRDIILHITRETIEKSAAIPISSIMSSDILSVTGTMDIHEACLLMATKKVHRLPVCQNGKIIGILSLSDLSKKKIFLAEVGEICGAIAK